MLVANAVTTSLPRVLANSSSNASTTSYSEPREPGPLDVRAVAEQHEHALRAELGEPVEVEVLAVERRLVDLEIPRVDDRADRGLDRQRQRVRECCA